jgi:hypothetical protein
VELQDMTDEDADDGDRQTMQGGKLTVWHMSPCALHSALPSAVTHSVPSQTADGRDKEDEDLDEDENEERLLLLDADDDLADDSAELRAAELRWLDALLLCAEEEVSDAQPPGINCKNHGQRFADELADDAARDDDADERTAAFADDLLAVLATAADAEDA